MRFWRHKGDVHELREQLSELRRDLAMVRDKYDRLVAEGDTPRRENAVLRYELQKCQRDRQVLEWHLTGTRSELQLALALLRKLQAVDAAEDSLAGQTLRFCAQARLLGFDGEALQSLEAAARRVWQQQQRTPWALEVERELAAAAAALLARLNAQGDHRPDDELDTGLQEAIREGLPAILPEHLSELVEGEEP